MTSFDIPPLGWTARLADICMIPIMWLLSGAPFERPQRTHFWNNCKFNPQRFEELHSFLKMIYSDGNPDVISQGWFRFHLPLFGGWRKYIVIEPQAANTDIWHIGWCVADEKSEPILLGISRIALRGSVRVLRGKNKACFFGISEEGRQIPLSCIGVGVIGKGGPFRFRPLL